MQPAICPKALITAIAFGLIVNYTSETTANAQASGSNAKSGPATRGKQGADLILAAENGDLPRVKELLAGKADVNAKRSDFPEEGGTA